MDATRMLVISLTLLGISLGVMFVQDATLTGRVVGPFVESSVLERLDAVGEVRVIIVTREPSVSDGLGIGVSAIGKSRYAVGYLDEADLAMLRKDPRIVAIYADVPVSIDLAQSVGIMNASFVQAMQIQGDNLTGAGSSVCVIDTGVDYGHPALGGCSRNAFLAGNCSKVLGGVDIVNGDDDPVDDHGHGTHVAGIIASTHQTYRGVAPGASIVAIKALDAAGSGWLSDAIAGVEWCTQNKDEYNVSVISMSLGSSSRFMNTCDSFMPFATDILHDAVEAGIHVVAATGNSGSNTSITFPSCVSQVIRVGSTNKDGSLSWFTNRAATFSDIIMAPGSGIVSLTLNNATVSSSGTSMATPHVSGTLALLDEYVRLRNGSFDQGAMGASLFEGSSLFDEESGVLFARLDARSALRALDVYPPDVSVMIHPRTVGVNGSVNVSWISYDEGDIDSFELIITDPSDGVVVVSNESSSGMLLDNLSSIGAYGVGITVNDTVGNSIVVQDTFFVKTSPKLMLEVDGLSEDTVVYAPANLSVNASIIEGSSGKVVIGSFNVSVNDTSLFEYEFGYGRYHVTFMHEESDAYFEDALVLIIDVLDSSITVITISPQNSSVSIGEDVSQIFMIEAIDELGSDLSYTWLRDGVMIGENDSLVLDALAYDPGEYALIGVVENEHTNRTVQWDVLIVPVPPTITNAYPSEGAVLVTTQEEVMFSIIVSDVKDRDISYVWSIDEASLGENDTFVLNLSQVAFDEAVVMGIASNGVMNASHSWQIVRVPIIAFNESRQIVDVRVTGSASAWLTLSDHFYGYGEASFDVDIEDVEVSFDSGRVRFMRGGDDALIRGAMISAQVDGVVAQSNAFMVEFTQVHQVSAPSGGGGGGGGGMRPAPVEEVHVAIEEDHDPVVERIVEVASVGELSVRAQSRASVRIVPGITPPVPFDGIMFSSFIMEADNDAVEDASLSFTVPYAWFDDVAILPDSVALYRLERDWVELETRLLERGDDGFVYEASVPHFSVFAIGVSAVRMEREFVSPVFESPLGDSLGDQDDAWQEESWHLALSMLFVLYVLALAFFLATRYR